MRVPTWFISHNQNPFYENLETILAANITWSFKNLKKNLYNFSMMFWAGILDLKQKQTITLTNVYLKISDEN